MPNSDPARIALAEARECAERCDWPGAYQLLQAADGEGQLAAEGLEFFADCARWTGSVGQVVPLLERAHQAYGTEREGAVRTALSLCYTHMDACENSPAASWWRRADELIVGLPEGPQHALHTWFAGRARGDLGDINGHEELAQKSLEIARRFGDRNTEALALVDLAHTASARGRSADALELLDCATALALGGEIGVMQSGLVFCNAIIAYRSRGEWDRAQQWTDSANRWVQRVQVSYFPGLCRVHRAEVLRIRGELHAAETEAIEAARLLQRSIPRWQAMAYIELGEVRRRRGDQSGAFEALQKALELGWNPQPAFAMLMLNQGDAAAAHKALVRYCRSKIPTLLCEDRTNLLRSHTTIAIAAGDLEAATGVVAQLEELASGDSLPWDRASFAQSSGELALAKGQIATAIDCLQEARGLWAELDVPYELGGVCLRLGNALCRDGDALGAQLEFEAARGGFTRIGAQHDLALSTAALEALTSESAAAQTPSTVAATASLRRNGDYWLIEFDQRSIQLRHSLGLAYLARLLRQPEQEVLAADLAGDGSIARADGDAGEILDPQAKAAYRTRLVELQRELEEAESHHDLGRCEQFRAEMDQLTRALSAAIGLGGRARRAGDTFERARQSVTKAIRTAVRKLGSDHVSLGRYLGNTIRTGITCQFEPDPGRPVDWIVDLGTDVTL